MISKHKAPKRRRTKQEVIKDSFTKPVVVEEVQVDEMYETKLRDAGIKSDSKQGHDVDKFYEDVCPNIEMSALSTEEDMVNHPPHYNAGNIEVIDFIEDQEHLGYHLLQAIRYITRSPFKGSEQQDLDKAIWYLNRHTKRMRELEVVND